METPTTNTIPQNFFLRLTNSLCFRMLELIISFAWMMLFGTFGYETEVDCSQIKLLNWSKISFWLFFAIFTLQIFIVIGDMFGFLNLNKPNFRTWIFWDYLTLSILASLIITALIGNISITLKIYLEGTCKYLFYLNRIFVIYYGCYSILILISFILSQIFSRKGKNDSLLHN